MEDPELDPELAQRFQAFCQAHGMTEEEAFAAALYSFMSMGPRERDAAILQSEALDGASAETGSDAQGKALGRRVAAAPDRSDLDWSAAWTRRPRFQTLGLN